MSSGGEAETEKSERKTVSGREAAWAVVPLVPVTVKSRGFELDAERPLTVKMLDWPTLIEAGLNEQVAPEEQPKLTFSTKLFGPDTCIVKVVDAPPIRIVEEFALAASE